MREGTCSINSAITNDEAVLTGDATSPGSEGASDNNGPKSSDKSTSPDGVPVPRQPCESDPAGCPRDEYTVVTVTLSDIARFRPTPGRQEMEPDGWVVVGLPANIYAVVNPQVVPGTLLGESADVRFTPVGYRWDYGDGASATLPSKGATWSALGLREFDATPTSHIYARSGSYTIRLSIVYRAEYRLAGGPFVPIAGTITLPANELYITAGGAKTVLVDRDCLRAPTGPGC